MRSVDSEYRSSSRFAMVTFVLVFALYFILQAYMVIEWDLVLMSGRGVKTRIIPLGLFTAILLAWFLHVMGREEKLLLDGWLRTDVKWHEGRVYITLFRVPLEDAVAQLDGMFRRGEGWHPTERTVGSYVLRGWRDPDGISVLLFQMTVETVKVFILAPEATGRARVGPLADAIELELTDSVR